ncbi:MAG TPA: hypothetical protein PKA13_10730 [Geminicoccaceae bacterium]|nr:hypothetical protein [Geminicoccus sp.]HMU50240.1 hypothetical protein [Geminicoccaceae bacterium]
MATSEELLDLIAEVEARKAVARKYGGARRYLTGAGFYSIDFATADDTALRWLQWCRDNPGPVASQYNDAERALNCYLETIRDRND